MIYLKLFLTYLEIGAVSFGGGYAMISLIREKCLTNGWLGEEEIMNFIAISESTPGPIAVNMATFTGSSQAGFWGAFFATLGLVIPSFIIILIIASIAKGFMTNKNVQGALGGIKPVVTGLILGTGVTMLLSVVLGMKNLTHADFDIYGAIILVIIHKYLA